MTHFRKWLGSVAAASVLLASSAPALARPGWGHGGHGGYYRPHYRYGHGGDGFGNFLLGAIVAGGVIAVASAASKDSRARQGRVIDTREDRSAAGEDSRAWSDEENAAADICADSAEGAASQHAEGQKVDDIKYVDRDGEGYRVEGVMRDGRAFNCGVRNSELSYIQFQDRVAAR